MCIDETAVNPEDFSYCGVNCNACDVFKGTVHGDQEARLRAADPGVGTQSGSFAGSANETQREPPDSPAVQLPADHASNRVSLRDHVGQISAE